MASKRKISPKRDELVGRERKKVKTAEARNISIQTKANSASQVRVDKGMEGLPSTIDIERFVEARAYEIDAMHTAMKSAAAGATTRAWQELPRHLRRRAASHNPHRVPSFLKERAKKEIEPTRSTIRRNKGSRIGKSHRLERSQSLLRRQRDKSWLETHLWHAKRMHMKNMWGFRLASHSTEKSFRASHRAAMRGAILHDASYMSLFELKGDEKVLIELLQNCCDPQGAGPGSNRYTAGARVLETHIYVPEAYPFDLLAPITLLWRPKQAEMSNTRIVWIFVHPAAHENVLSALQTSASSTLERLKRMKDASHQYSVEIAHLHRDCNIFEIMGPKASQVVKGALTPIFKPNVPQTELKQFWNSLTNLQTAGSLPRNMVVGFQVQDPRLKFPPKNARLRTTHPKIPWVTLPSAQLADSNLWDEKVREKLRVPKYDKASLDARRQKLLVPGTPLTSTSRDDQVPILMIQRSLECSAQSQGVHGWTIIVPAGWAMPFFASLTFTGTRVAGQQERHTQIFEAGCAHFPSGYPTTVAYAKHAQEMAKAELQRWERKPPAKRPNFEKLGTISPWIADWEAVLDLKQATPDGLLTTQRDPSPWMRPWLFQGSEVPTIIDRASRLLNPALALLDEINRLRLKRDQDPLALALRAADLWKGALVIVHISMRDRGAPQRMAMIYKLQDDEILRWRTAFHLSKLDDVQLEADYVKRKTINGQDIIGYVNHGDVSLSRGKGFAIGCIPLSCLFELQDQAQRLNETKGLWAAVQNRNSETLRTVRLEIWMGTEHSRS